MPRKIKTTTSKSYLERLQFDPKLLASIVAKYITNIRIVILLALTIVLLGVTSYLSLPKRLNPEVKIPIISVATVLPGAGPADVESLVTVPIENQLKSVKGIDTISSISQDNISVVTMQFFSTVSQDKAKSDVQSSIDTLNDLPENSQRPKVTALDFEDQPVWVFGVTSNTSNLPALMNFSKDLKKRIEDSTKVDRVITSGYEEQEIVIMARPEKIQEFGLNPLTLSQSIKKSIASYPAGSVNSDGDSFALTIDPAVTSIKDIRNLHLNVQGKSLLLGDIATIEEQSKPDQQHTYVTTSKLDPSRGVVFYVYKTSSVNIDEAGNNVKQIVDKALSEYHGSFKVTTISNTSEEITKQFSDLLREFRSTIILVFLCLFVFLGLRQAIISSFTVPLTFLSAFVFMRFFGMSINFLSLFAFLLALGLLVDDTIVTVSAMTMYYRSGRFTPQQTGLLVWKDTIVPIWSTTITTIWSFVPLLLTSGIIGEFIKPIPIVVTVTMISSTAIAVLITLPLMIVLLKPSVPHRVNLLLKIVGILLSLWLVFFLFAQNKLVFFVAIIYLVLLFLANRFFPAFSKKVKGYFSAQPQLKKMSTAVSKFTDHGVINVDGLSHKYHTLILRILNSPSAQKKVVFAIVLYAIVSFALLPLGLVKNEFFPKSDQDLLNVSLELPAGTNIQVSEEKGIEVLKELRSTPETEFISAEVGRSSNTNTVSANAQNYVFYTLHLVPKEKRKISSLTIAEDLRKKFSHYPSGTISVVEESGGPPAGADLQIKLLGNDLGTLDNYADKLIAFLKTQKGATNVNKSIHSGTSKLVFVPDSSKLAEVGLSPDAISLWLRMYASGFTLDSPNFDKNSRDKQDIVFKVEASDRSPVSISEMNIFTPAGVSYPLLSLGRFEMKPNPTLISREDGKRTISVTAAIQPGFTVPEENKKLEQFADTLQLPNGYSWKTGGVNEENAKSVASILQAMLLSAILILITMVIQFASFRQAIIVLIVIPLAVSSVFLAFALTGTPLSFPALIGVLSLFGIVVTNSMFIVDKINLNQREGLSFKESIADAGASRLEPIILTKLCTVFGLLPITITNPLWRGLGGAIISGLLVSSTIMLLFIPVLYYWWFKSDFEKK
jgi:HAE1 family hydrophobic/amphiphilic exporter-1